MTTRAQHMEALRKAWLSLPPGIEKLKALAAYEAAQEENMAHIEKLASAYFKNQRQPSLAHSRRADPSVGRYSLPRLPQAPSRHS